MTKTIYTCAFTGHRHIAQNELPALKQRLENTIETLINQGVVFYACGGAIGFDMLAGFTILRLKEKYNYIRLIMVLPCRNQDIGEKCSFSGKQRLLYRVSQTHGKRYGPNGANSERARADRIQSRVMPHIFKVLFPIPPAKHMINKR